MSEVTFPIASIKYGHEFPGASMNVRTTERDKDQKALEASIGAEGLLQPLAVVAGEGVFWTIDGNRRLAALRAMKTKEIPASYLRIVDYIKPGEPYDINAAIAKGLAANIQRVPLHPVDRFEAFAALKEDPPAIAARFGIDEKSVRRCLALGTLAPEIRAHWRAGKMEEAAARAFTIVPDLKRQKEVFAQLKKRGGMHAYNIKQALAGNQENAAGMLIYVGEAEYRKAGGQVSTDLFAERDDAKTNVNDLALLEKLAFTKAKDEIDKLKKDGWGWISFAADLPDEWRYHWPKVGVGAKPREKFGVVLTFGKSGLMPIVGVSKTPVRVKAEKRAAKKKIPGMISNSLMDRISQWTTFAARDAMPKQAFQFALASLLAGLTANDDQVIDATYRGLQRNMDGHGGYNPDAKRTTFAVQFEQFRKMSLRKLEEAVGAIVGEACNFRTFSADRPPLRKGAQALTDAMERKDLNGALRAHFAKNASDYFKGVNATLRIGAIKEALGDDHARRTAKLKGAEQTKFAAANVPKTGWLPPQMRTANYDGPGAGKKKAKKRAKK